MNRNTSFVALPQDADRLAAETFREFNRCFDELWIIRLYKANYTIRQIAEILEMSRTTVFRKLNTWKKLNYVKRFLKS